MRMLLCFCATLLMAVLFPLVSRADVSIVSEYQSPFPGQPLNTVFWDFIEVALADGGTMIEVQDRDQKMGCRAELYYDEKQALVQADAYRNVRGDEVCDARRYSAVKPAILSYSLVPGDWLNRSLPFAAVSEKREYAVYEQIGTARFTANLEVQERPVSFAQALSSGMIRNDLQGGLVKAEKLYIVEVKRRGGGGRLELVLQQLWMEGDRFWLFEAKNGRRSWRLAKE